MPSTSSLAAAAILCASILASGAVRADEGTVRLFAIWEGSGSVVQTGAAEATLVGTMEGNVYVDADDGPVGAGEVTCPMIMHQDLKDTTQSGIGQCTFKGVQGELWFMTLTCTGAPLVGCAGESTLTGGTGRFEKLSGGGHFIIRSNMSELAKGAGLDMKGKARGIIFWRGLHYKFP